MRIKKVEYVNGYKLKLLFSDKKIKIVDIEPIINNSKGLFHPLKDVEYFKKVFLDDSQYPLSICWPNGEDLCPDVLYAMGTDVKGTPKKVPIERKNRAHAATKKLQARISAKSKH